MYIACKQIVSNIKRMSLKIDGLFVVLSTINSGKQQTFVTVTKNVELRNNILLVVELNSKFRNLKSLELQKFWSKSSRGLKSRLRKGIEISLKENFQCYSPAKVFKKYNLKKYKFVKSLNKY